jgi:hypothetical protein
MSEYKNHRLYPYFVLELEEDQYIANLFQDNEEDFFTWALSYEVDSDWVSKTS